MESIGKFLRLRKTALERIPQVNPDVVVLDIFMPELNGLETASEIRRMMPVPKLILMSGAYTPDEAAVLARLFADGHFIAKTEIGKELIPTINNLLPQESEAHRSGAT